MTGGGAEGPERILRYIFSLAGLAVLVRVAGFAEKVFFAHYFGTGKELDAFTVA